MRINEVLANLPHITAQGPLDADALQAVVQQRNAQFAQRRAEQRRRELALQQQREIEWRRRHPAKKVPSLYPAKKRKRGQRQATRKRHLARF